MIGLTKRQADALRFIRGYVEANDGVSPSYAEIRDGIGATSKGAIVPLIQALEERGHIDRLSNRARAIEVLTDIPIPRSPSGEPLFFLPAPEARA